MMMTFFFDRLMYWSSASRHGRRQYQIERAYLDGSQRVVVISGIRALTAFTIDYDKSMLYWADKRVIEASKTDGKPVSLLWARIGDREPIIVNISHESKSVRNSEAAIWQWMCLIG